MQQEGSRKSSYIRREHVYPTGQKNRALQVIFFFLVTVFVISKLKNKDDFKAMQKLVFVPNC